jgi:UDP-N-acetylmuramoylalanine-D-glutamate ligase
MYGQSKQIALYWTRLVQAVVNCNAECSLFKAWLQWAAVCGTNAATTTAAAAAAAAAAANAPANLRGSRQQGAS